MNHNEVWRLHVKCKGMPPNWWFPDRGDQCIAAQRVCADCPVNRDCLNYAVANGEKFGIWGGMGERGRRHLRALQRDCPHPERSALPECRCAFCREVNIHFERLAVLAATGRGISPARPTFGPSARHGTKSTYKRGCPGDACRVAMGLRPRGQACLVYGQDQEAG